MKENEVLDQKNKKQKKKGPLRNQRVFLCKDYPGGLSDSPYEYIDT